MRRNRKKSETYRFNGYPHLHAGSIHSVDIATLEARATELERKLADPTDGDDKKWVKRWLDRYRAELAKKRKGLALKRRSRSQRRGDGPPGAAPDNPPMQRTGGERVL